jgi:excisionase family DNA binding protein
MPGEAESPLKDWITTKEAAELTGYTSAHIRQLIKRGKLQAHKLGRDWFLNRGEVVAYAEKMQRLGPAKYDPWRTGARERAEDQDEET